MQHSKSSGFIPGIYNYCDRWCERCNFTSRCATYAAPVNNPKKEPDNRDNKEFWEELAEIFKTTAQLILQMAEKEGIDLSAIDTKQLEELESQKEKRLTHDLIKMARGYDNSVQDWKKKNQEEIRLYLSNIREPEELQVSLHDAFEVISWYQHLITSKIYRALGSEESEREFELDPYDSNGSAKIALISVERTMNAWALIVQNLIKYEDDILPMLVSLEKLKNSIREYFPDAENFIRPGLDES